MNGIIVYEEKIAPQRSWYIEQYRRYFLLENISLTLITVGGDESWKDQVKRLSPDFAVVRMIAPSVSEYLEGAGIRCFNSANVSKICNNKHLTYEFVRSNTDVRFLPYIYPMTEERLKNASWPRVVKSLDGHGGQQVLWADSLEDLKEKLPADLWGRYLAQEVAKTLAVDTRVYILGGKIMAAMCRRGKEDFRSNYCLGGTAYQRTLSSEEERAVLQIADALKADFIGIDLLQDGDGYAFNEVEDVVGARMLYDLTDIDIVKEYVAYIRSQIR